MTFVFLTGGLYLLYPFTIFTYPPYPSDLDLPLYVETHTFTLICPIPILYHRVLDALFCLSLTFFSNGKKSGLVLVCAITDQSPVCSTLPTVPTPSPSRVPRSPCQSSHIPPWLTHASTPSSSYSGSDPHPRASSHCGVSATVLPFWAP